MANNPAAAVPFSPDINPPAVNMFATRIDNGGGLLNDFPMGCKAQVVHVGRAVIRVRRVRIGDQQLVGPEVAWRMERWAPWVEPVVEPPPAPNPAPEGLVSGSKIQFVKDYNWCAQHPGYPLGDEDDTRDPNKIHDVIDVRLKWGWLSAKIDDTWWPVAGMRLAQAPLKIGDIIYRDVSVNEGPTPQFFGYCEIDKSFTVFDLTDDKSFTVFDLTDDKVRVGQAGRISGWMSLKWFKRSGGASITTPPKPPEPIVAFPEFVERFKPKLGIGCAAYGGLYKTDEGPIYDYSGYTGCHSGLLAYVKTNRRAWVNSCHKPYHKLWLEYIMNPETSPWRRLIPYVIAKPVEHGVVFFVDTEASKHLSAQYLMSFAKAPRIYTEGSNFGKTTDYLLDNGVHPGIAFWFGQYFSDTGAAELTPYTQGWHGSFNQHEWSFETMQNFIDGKTPEDNKLVAQNQNSYMGCDSIFHKKNADNTSLTDELKKYMPELFEPKKVVGKFTTTTRPAYTRENILKAAQSLTDRLGFTDA